LFQQTLIGDHALDFAAAAVPALLLLVQDFLLGLLQFHLDLFLMLFLQRQTQLVALIDIGPVRDLGQQPLQGRAVKGFGPFDSDLREKEKEEEKEGERERAKNKKYKLRGRARRAV
jgi:hypothetical protein